MDGRSVGWRAVLRVHDLVQARAVLAAAEQAGLDIALASATGSARYAGIGYWKAIEDALGRSVIVDCGEREGLVLAGLRAGLRDLLFSGPQASHARLADIAGQLGGRIRARLDPPVLELAPGEDAAARLGTIGCGARLGSAGGRVYQGCSDAPSGETRGYGSMQITAKVKEILSWYEGENPGVKASLVRLLMNGRLAGTGKLVILPVDQGYEHGPARSFAPNPAAYDPHYLYELAIEAGLSGYAAPLGLLQQGADTFAGQVPTILKLNSANSMGSGPQDQAITASVDDALRLGCVAVGFTMYPGADACYAMQEELRELTREAKAKGLAVVVWSYPRGGKVSKEGETALDIVAYAAHMAALMGANIIKVKPPAKAMIDLDANRSAYEKAGVPMETLSERVRHVMQASFAGKRLVVFSGGEAKDTAGLLDEIRQIRDGGGNGAIIGRNSFQRPKAEALQLLDSVIKIYLGQS